MIDRETVDRILDTADIVDVVSDFVSLRRRGANFIGLCPFHDEKTPSFSVSPAKQICHCFGCGKGGSPVNFVMEHEQMSYAEALRYLAKKYNIEIHEKELTSEEKAAQTERESMLVINDFAAQYFEEQLHNTDEGKDVGLSYFYERGFNDSTIKKFRLGYSPENSRSFYTAATKQGYNKQNLFNVGLCIDDHRGGGFDRFHGRVMFPVMNIAGKIIAFGGRTLKKTKEVAKYFNSPESAVYVKNRELYGLFQSKRAIVKEDKCYLVEGYTDVISMHQAGIENVVASSGTSLTEGQIRAIHRFTQNVTVLYDGDSAGIKASLRGIDMLLAEGLSIKVLLLPEGEDPDSFARSHSSSELKQFIKDNETDFISFKTRILLEGTERDPIKRAEAISSIVKSISVIPDQIKRAEYIKQCSTNIGTPERTLINEMNKFIRREREEKYKEAEREAARQPQNKPIERPTTNKLVEDVERMLTQEVVRHGEEVIFRDVQLNEGEKSADITAAEYVYYDLSADQLRFQNPIYNRILEEAVAHIHDDGFKADEYFRSHPDQQVNQVATELSTETYILARSNQMRQEDDSLQSRVLHLLLDYRMIYVKNRLGELKQLLPKTPENERAALQQEWMKLLAIRQEIARRVGHSIIVS